MPKQKSSMFWYFDLSDISINSLLFSLLEAAVEIWQKAQWQISYWNPGRIPCLANRHLSRSNGCYGYQTRGLSMIRLKLKGHRVARHTDECYQSTEMRMISAVFVYLLWPVWFCTAPFFLTIIPVVLSMSLMLWEMCSCSFSQVRPEYWHFSHLWREVIHFSRIQSYLRSE